MGKAMNGKCRNLIPDRIQGVQLPQFIFYYFYYFGVDCMIKQGHVKAQTIGLPHATVPFPNLEMSTLEIFSLDNDKHKIRIRILYSQFPYASQFTNMN